MKLTPQQVVDSWRRYSDFDARFALASAYHETGYEAGEVDVGDQGDGSDSKGLYQLSDGERRDSGLLTANLLDADDNTHVFASICQIRLALIRTAATAAQFAGKPYVEEDEPAYLAMAHNMGIGSALKSIARYGLDWSAYKARPENADLPFVAKGYGDDAISGGPDWDDAFVAQAPTDENGVTVEPSTGLGTRLCILALAALGLGLLLRPWLKGIFT